MNSGCLFCERNGRNGFSEVDEVPQLRVFFVIEEKNRKKKMPLVTDHSRAFHQFLVAGIKTLKCTTNLCT